MNKKPPKPSTNQWIVITGGPSSGKTTLINGLKERGYTVSPEAARQIIDESLATGISVADLRADEKQFQEAVAKLKHLQESSLNKNDTIFFDRGMYDTLAYMNYYKFKIDDWLAELIRDSTYKLVLMLEPLGHYEADYARTEDEQFSKSISALLYKAYASAGIKIIKVPPLAVKARINFIIDQLK
jgi:predicted ATPase